MNRTELKQLSYDDLRAAYKFFLLSQDIQATTANTAYVDTFYLWRNGSKEYFWSIVEAKDFEADARAALLTALRKNSTGNADKLVNSYLSHLRRFRLFLASDGMAKPTVLTKTEKTVRKHPRRKAMDIEIPDPSTEQVEYYLAKWDGLENYHLQEDALDKLFHELCPKNTEITDVLIKATTLNVFYSTNIKSIYPMAKHIHELDIDVRLKAGDVTLVDDIKPITTNGKTINHYSFATKYCSHHNAMDYPIYDSYVDEVLRYFRDRDGFEDFADGELKDYVHFKGILLDFRQFYDLEKYNLKQIDQYLWQLGKEYFPKYEKK